MSAINTIKNHIQYLRTKHIEVRHHFVTDHVVKGVVSLHFVPTERQLIDIFTKPINEEQFSFIRSQSRMIYLEA